MKHCLPLWLLVFLLLHWPGAARAMAGPPATGRPLAEALNPDGTLKTGAAGSFDARGFRMGTAPDGRPVFSPAGALGAGDERWASGFGLPNGTDGAIRAIVRSGTDVYVGGDFTTVGNLVANHIAKWNGTAWSTLGTGLGNGNVYALAVAANGDLYVGGSFTQAGTAAAYGMARWNGTGWSALGTGTGTGNGTNGTVNALAIADNGDVYVGGAFSVAGGTGASYIARWNGTAWSPLGAGVRSGSVNALVMARNGDVYAGGAFVEAGGVPASRIARWNGTAWSAVGGGVSNGVLGGTVNALAVAGNGDVYAGGYFIEAGGVAANRVARWNGMAWSALGASVANGLDNPVFSLFVAVNGDLYVGGHFTQAGGGGANNIAKWNGAVWSSLGTGTRSVVDGGTSGGVNDGTVNALAAAANGDLYVGGLFLEAGGVRASYVAAWNGTTWSSVGAGPGNGVDAGIYALAVAGNGDVYVGGAFTQVGGVPVNRVAKWNGVAWSALGTGASNGFNEVVFALAVAGNGDIYAGGGFTQVGGVTVNNVARWNGTSWSALGTGAGNGVDGTVYALAMAGNGSVYVGGYFNRAGTGVANNIALWNGTAWSPLMTGMGNGVDRPVYALAMAGNGDIYAGGDFTQASGITANHIARWNGTAWSSVGTGAANGVDRYVSALVVAANGDVYAGGNFNRAGVLDAYYIARWNGIAWSALGSGQGISGSSIVTTLAIASTGDVYAGGGFKRADGIVVNQVAKWNGTAWNALGTGVNGGVNVLATSTTGKVYTGGTFTTTGDGSKAMARFAIYDPNAPLATTAARATPAAQFFPNPAHGTATLRLPAGAARQPLLLSDALGRLVRQYPAPASAEAVLDLRGLPAGTYLVRCGELSQRLVVE
jgi:trimeric autotransporter adhesin